TRCTVDLEMPLSWAAWRTLQWVAPAGLRERVRLSKTAICSSAMLRRPQLIVQTRHTLLQETLSPLAHRGLGPAQTLSNLCIALARGRPQHYLSASDEGMRQRTRSRPTLQLCAFVHSQIEGGFGASGEHSAAYRRLDTIAGYLWDTTLAEGFALSRIRSSARSSVIRRWYRHRPSHQPSLRASRSLARRLAHDYCFDLPVVFGGEAGCPLKRSVLISTTA